MGKGDRTRAEILEQATELASRIGLEGLTVGTLAATTGMSKSGLFAHFGSKEELQLAIVETAARQYEELVVRPALAAPRGEPRLRAYLDLWLRWAHEHHPESGCFFVQATAEFDDQPGRVRDALEHQQRRLLEFLAGAADRAIGVGHFHDAVDPQQFAFELHAIALGYHHSLRMMGDELAPQRARRATEDLFERCAARTSTTETQS